MKAGKLAGLHVITDRTLSPGRSHQDVAEAALRGGASVIQYREKQRSVEEMCAEAGRILALCRTVGVPLLINDWVEVACRIGADGVHLGQGDLPCSEARRLLGRDAIIGISAATPDQAVAARQEGADYIGVGPIYPTGSKADAGEATGLAHIERMKAAGRLPVIAVGGINLENIGEVARAGADGVAVISAVVCAPDMEQAVRDLVAAWRRGKEVLISPDEGMRSE